MSGSEHDSMACGESEDIAGFDLVSLARSLAQLHGGRLAFVNDERDIEASVSFVEFNTLIGEYTGALHAFGLHPGECVLIAGCSGPRAFAALIAALAAGLDAAVCGLHLEASQIGAFAQATHAAAIVSDAQACDDELSERIMSAAALAASVRLVVSLAADAPDGAVSIEAACGASMPVGGESRPGRIITRDGEGRPVAHLQQTLITAGFDFLSQTQIGAGLTLVSTILPSSFAGLVCGPIAGLLTGATTILHAPFNSKKLIARIEADKPVQLIAPAGLAAAIEKSSLARKESLACLVLLTRLSENATEFTDNALPRIDVPGVRIADFIAFGEIAAVAERRDGSGARTALLQHNHTIHMDGREVLAFRAMKHFLDNNGTRATAFSLEGAAVTKTDWRLNDPAA